MPGLIVAAEVGRLTNKVVDVAVTSYMMENTVRFMLSAKPSAEYVICSTARNGVIKRKVENWKQIWLRSKILILVLWQVT